MPNLLVHLTAGDHDFIVDEVKKAAISVDEVLAVSEVQVYYKDSGEISCKVDIVLPPSLTIRQAHSIASKLHLGPVSMV
jgi:divalent metal cation (Fe/Co/Zn/Cd) transporter